MNVHLHFRFVFVRKWDFIFVGIFGYSKKKENALSRQLFSVIMSSLLESLRIACSFAVFPNVSIAVLDHHCLLFPFNGCLSVIDC